MQFNEIVEIIQNVQIFIYEILLCVWLTIQSVVTFLGFDPLPKELGFTAIKMAAVIGLIMNTVPLCILGERKFSAWMQDRQGPNRAGPLGLLQPLSDAGKLIFKEDFMPAGVDKVIYCLAPAIAMTLALIGLAVIPFGRDLVIQAQVLNVPNFGAVEIARQVIPIQIAQINIGILYILAVGSLGAYGVVLGGWASNSKYAFLGGLRAAAQMLSYEVPLALAILCMVLLCGTLSMETMINQQILSGGGILGWNIFTQPVTFVIFMICIFAETNRAPFDLAECEQELVAGFHTEYGSMKFAMFFLGEYVHMIIGGAFATIMFFGGWHIPFLPEPIPGFELIWMLISVGVFYAKIWCFLFFYMWVRWTLPRFRYDQLMHLAWKGLVPIGLALLVFNSWVVYQFPMNITEDGQTVMSISSRLCQLIGNITIIGLLIFAVFVRNPNIGAGNKPIPLEELLRDKKHV